MGSRTPRLRPPTAAVGIAHTWHSITLRSGGERRRAVEVAAKALSGLQAVVFGSEHTRREGELLGLAYPSIAETIHFPLQSLYLDNCLEVNRHERMGVAYLGSLIERKRPASLVEAATSLPGTPITFAGHGELEQPLRALIGRLKLADRIRIVRLEDTAARDLLLRSQAMCLPSHSETFGLAYIEALACGTPVVGFGPTLGEIRDEMEIEIGEPLESDAPEEIAAAIERVLTFEWDRGELRRATIKAFGLKGVTDCYLELLSRLTSQRQETRPQSVP